MKIQGCNVESFQTRSASNVKAKGEFGGVIVNAGVKEDRAEEEVLPSPVPKMRAALNVDMSTALRPAAGNTDRFKNFAREAVSLRAQDIKQSIEEMCSDETGVNIDVEHLDELLDAYMSDMK